MSSWRASCRRVGLLVYLLGLGATALGAQESDIVERLFVARVEQPDVSLRVTSLRGGDVFEGSSNAEGQLVFTLKVAQTDEIRFASTDPDWLLDWVKPVRNAHLDPEIPLELDVGAFLRRAETRPVSSPDSATESKAENDGGGPDDPLGCTRADDMRCLLRLQRSLAEARDRGDCRTALKLAQRMQDELPTFAATDAGALALAELHLTCAFVETVDDDPYARRDLLLRHAVALAAGADGVGWCRRERSWILATAHAALRETASAAAAARRARSLCPSSPATYEWEFTFRLGLGQTDRAAEVAAETAKAPEQEHDDREEQSDLAKLAAFLEAWSTFASGQCPDVDRWIPANAETMGESPCTVLRDGSCERARTAWILHCGDPAQLARYGEALRETLDGGGSNGSGSRGNVSQGNVSDGADRWLLEDLAEVESARGRWDEAADLFARLAARFGGDSPGRTGSPASLGAWACRRGDALLRADRPAQALDAFETASRAWQDTELSASRLDRLVVENNALVLASQVRGEVDGSRLDALPQRLAALGDEERFVPWRLAVENNLLELRTRVDAERAEIDPMRARAALERLREVEAEYRRHVESVVLQPASGLAALDAAKVDRPRPCSKLAFAGAPD